MCLPSCSEQCERNRAPQLGAGGPIRERERGSLSDKDLEPVVDDPVKNGLSPWGYPAKLLQDHRRHPFVKSLSIISVPLAICPAFGQFFSEKFLGHGEIWTDCVNLHIQP